MPSDPEISDGTKDLQLSGLTFGSTTYFTPEIDIVRAWFEADAAYLRVHWEVVNFSHRWEPDEALGFSASYRCGSDEMTVTAHGAPPRWYGAAYVSRADGGNEEYDSYPSVTGNVVTAKAPLSAHACGTITHAFAQSVVLHHRGDDRWSGTCGIGGFCDIAPDSGYGRAFTIR